MTGNEAMAEAAIKSGCVFYAGYPITPQNEIPAYMARRMKEEGRVFIQAESELAAINMVFGASASGARAMASSSSPGISLKQEGISYLSGCQLPALIINVQRAGPGLGNITSSQSDYFQATRGGGHGDYFNITLCPWSVDEAVELVMLGFDLADYYRNPIIILADAIIGQMMEPVSFPLKSGFNKKLSSKDWALTGAKGRAPNSIQSLFLKEGVLYEHNEMLRKKWEKIRDSEQRYALDKAEGAQILIVAYGSQARITVEAIDLLRKKGVKAGLFRPITAWPYPYQALKEAAKGLKRVLVVEQSLGQMVEDVKLALSDKEVHFLGKAGGGIPSVLEIIETVNNLSFIS